MKKSNMDVRTAAKKAGVYLWQIAEELGVAEATVIRRLRPELCEEEKRRFFEIIEKLGRS